MARFHDSTTICKSTGSRVAAFCLVALTPFLSAQVFSVKHSFQGPPDGANAFAGLILDRAGNLYGTTESGGDTNNGGTIFQITPAGTETVLYRFAGGSDGEHPGANLLFDSTGNLYGTTQSGGQFNVGTIFKYSASGQESVLYTFTGGADGGTPKCHLIRDGQGNLYGTAESGGASGNGVVFKLDASGNETVLYSFKGGLDGAIPQAGLVPDSKSNLYGVTTTGGDVSCNAPYGCGTIFRLSLGGKEIVIHRFTGTNGDGAFPVGDLILDQQGTLYGTTESGGDPSCFGGGGCGTVFEVSKSGHLLIIYRFKPSGGDGQFPEASLIRDAVGNLYGTTYQGGSTGFGTAFKVSNTGRETVLHSFDYLTDGAQPISSLVRDGSGNLYGTTLIDGGTGCGGLGCGTVFTITPTRSSPDVMSSRPGTTLKPEQLREANQNPITKHCTTANGQTTCN
jgi:uncharacterized repeat protein (TIGR03803 family)